VEGQVVEDADEGYAEEEDLGYGLVFGHTQSGFPNGGRGKYCTDVVVRKGHGDQAPSPKLLICNLPDVRNSMADMVFVEY